MPRDIDKIPTKFFPIFSIVKHVDTKINEDDVFERPDTAGEYLTMPPPTTGKFHTKRKRENVDASNDAFPGMFNSSQSKCTEAKCDDNPVEDTVSTHVASSASKETLVDQRPWKCSEEGCKKDYRSKRALAEHIKIIHSGQKKFFCKFGECVMVFARKRDLTAHMKSHSDERLYKCTICEKKFKHNGDMHSHIRTHNAARDHKCACGKAFKTVKSLKIHERSHWDHDSIEYREWADKRNAVLRLRYASDPEFRAAQLCRRRLLHLLKSQGGKKTGHTLELLGCTWQELVDHLNDNIFGYKVGDKGIHIDHIRPCASFQLADNPISQRACMNFNNLQLMPSEENIRKSDDYDADAYAEMPCGKAIAVLTLGWEKQFANGVENDVDFDSEWEEEDEEVEMEYEFEYEM
jgi:hypothetical protein